MAHSTVSSNKSLVQCCLVSCGVVYYPSITCQILMKSNRISSFGILLLLGFVLFCFVVVVGFFLFVLFWFFLLSLIYDMIYDIPGRASATI